MLFRERITRSEGFADENLLGGAVPHGEAELADLVGGMVGSNWHGRFRLITFKFEFAGSAGVISGGS
jgi:hypothetical protein